MASPHYATRGTIPELGQVWQPVGPTTTLLTAHLVRTDAARAFVPSGLSMVSVLPGWTVAATLLSYYGPESTLEYHELVVTAGLVRYRGAIAPFVSHIYVDNADSVTGGRRMGLPKEMAHFDWDGARPGIARLTRHDGVPLCTVRYGAPALAMPLTLAGPTISTIGGEAWRFTSKMSARWGLARVRYEVPEVSPFAVLGLGAPLLGLVAGAMRGEMGLGMHALGPLGGARG
jgi:hypothetical protein